MRNEEFYIDLGKRLKTLRKKNGLSQCKLAEKLGVKTQMVQRLEYGVNRIALDSLIIMSKLYNISIDEIVDLQKYDELKIIDKDEKKCFKFLSLIKNKALAAQLLASLSKNNL